MAENKDALSLVTNNRVVSRVITTLFNMGFHVQTRCTDDGVFMICYFDGDNPPESDGSSKSPYPPLKIVGNKLSLPAGTNLTVAQRFMQ